MRKRTKPERDNDRDQQHHDDERELKASAVATTRAVESNEPAAWAANAKAGADVENNSGDETGIETEYGPDNSDAPSTEASLL